MSLAYIARLPNFNLLVVKLSKESDLWLKPQFYFTNEALLCANDFNNALYTLTLPKSATDPLITHFV